MTGRILEIGRSILRRACLDVASYRAFGGELEDLVVSVNVSARQIQDDGFVDDAAAALGDAGLPDEALVLEITESVLIEDSQRAVGVLGALSLMGVKLSIDDFGTGYSSLSNLERFPVHAVKIDKSFIDSLAADGPSRHPSSASSSTLPSRSVSASRPRASRTPCSSSVSANSAAPWSGLPFARPMPSDALAALLQTSVSV